MGAGHDSKSIVYAGSWSADSDIRILDLSTMQSQTIPGSKGLWSPRMSPDGKYIVAGTSEALPRLMLYSFADQKWQLLPGGKHNGFQAWSHDSKYVYAYDVRRAIETVASLEGVSWTADRLRTNGWFDLTPDDRIMILRDTGSEEIYALELEY